MMTANLIDSLLHFSNDRIESIFKLRASQPHVVFLDKTIEETLNDIMHVLVVEDEKKFPPGVTPQNRIIYRERLSG